jgi:hypothetical protein
VDFSPRRFHANAPSVNLREAREVTVADVIDLTPKLLERTVDTLLVEQTVQRAFRRLRILNQAISQMREEGSTDADIADTLLYGAGELAD